MNDPARPQVTIRFRRMTMHALPLMYQWLQTPHVWEWWSEGRDAPVYYELVDKYGPCIRGEEPTDPYLICDAERPIGYIQTYLIRSFPEYAAAVDVEEGVA